MCVLRWGVGSRANPLQVELELNPKILQKNLEAKMANKPHQLHLCLSYTITLNPRKLKTTNINFEPSCFFLGGVVWVDVFFMFPNIWPLKSQSVWWSGRGGVRCWMEGPYG